MTMGPSIRLLPVEMAATSPFRYKSLKFHSILFAFVTSPRERESSSPFQLMPGKRPAAELVFRGVGVYLGFRVRNLVLFRIQGVEFGFWGRGLKANARYAACPQGVCSGG